MCSPAARSRTLLAALALGAAACRGPQSALDPAGRGADRIATLFTIMAVGAAVVWLAMVALTVFAVRVHAAPRVERRTALFILGGGALVPTVVLTALLVYGLALLPELVAPAPAGSLRVAVTGEQWWWRVRYPGPDGRTVELANEVHLPLGQAADLRLDSADVIHSFWIPSLGGKLDMFPGRTSRLALWPTRAGRYRGVCAEYCGASHALMAFAVVVEPRAALDRWLAHQSEPARPPTTPLGARGAALFLADGCGACHAVRGTPAAGTLGPDLTHVGSRHGLGAATLPNDAGTFARWITHPESLKPGVHMPAFGMLPPADVRALAAYLEELQ
ncbi:MAG: c-type cytochrome [Deltaproteobacteria bacterium]|nr:c-type cytochrome [Myxococcales bacterium]MDP3212888.1 c-type cytochrome [Deltaproteobacteria bacterium]